MFRYFSTYLRQINHFFFFKQIYIPFRRHELKYKFRPVDDFRTRQAFRHGDQFLPWTLMWKRRRISASVRFNSTFRRRYFLPRRGVDAKVRSNFKKCHRKRSTIGLNRYTGSICRVRCERIRSRRRVQATIGIRSIFRNRDPVDGTISGKISFRNTCNTFFLRLRLCINLFASSWIFLAEDGRTWKFKEETILFKKIAEWCYKNW